MSKQISAITWDLSDAMKEDKPGVREQKLEACIDRIEQLGDQANYIPEFPLYIISLALCRLVYSMRSVFWAHVTV